MNPFVFFAQVVAPVLVEVAVDDEGAEFEDGLGSLESPAGAGDVHAVFDQPSCRSLDDAGGDRPALGEGGAYQVFLLGGEVVRAGVGAFAFGWGVPEGGGAAADAGRVMPFPPVYVAVTICALVEGSGAVSQTRAASTSGERPVVQAGLAAQAVVGVRGRDHEYIQVGSPLPDLHQLPAQRGRHGGRLAGRTARRALRQRPNLQGCGLYRAGRRLRHGD